jgi:hypothetical protein
MEIFASKAPFSFCEIERSVGLAHTNQIHSSVVFGSAIDWKVKLMHPVQ